MNTTRKILCSSLAAMLCLLLTLCPRTSLAQEEQEAIMLEPVKVTAQKREENVQDIPVSVDVINAQTLHDAGIQNVEKLQFFVPNLYRSGSYMEHAFVIRGVKKFTSSTDANVIMYVDDVPLPMHYSHNVALMDMERVEVLKGPQGTLYGMNSEAGVINIVTKKPSSVAEGKVYAEYGSVDTSRFGGAFNLPLKEDILNLRLAGQHEHTDGHVTNIFTDNSEAAKEHTDSFRGTLSWTPTTPWTVNLSMDYLNAEDNQMTVRATEGPLAAAGYLESDYDFENCTEREESGLNLTLKYEGPDFTFLSVTGYRDFRTHSLQDWDVSSSVAFYAGENFSNYRDKMVTQELRLSSPDESGDFQWVAGLFGYLENLKIDCTDYTLLFTPVPWSEIDNSITKKGAAVFGEGTYTLWDDLHLTAGLRIAYDQLKGWRDSSTDNVELNESMHTMEFLPKFGVAYDLTDDAMAYASLSRGFMSGGFQYYYYSPTPTSETFSYKPEYTWNYEVGLKTSWLDDRLTANLAAFYIQIQDKQASQWDPVTQTSKVINAAEAHSKGIELEVSAIPAQGWSVFGGLGLTDARVDELDLNDGFDYAGKRMPDAPSYTFNLGAQHNHESGWFERVDLVGVGDFTGDFKNLSEENGFELVNVRFGKEWDFGSIYAWCDNVLDERYHTSVYAWDMSGTGTDRQADDGDPRSFGIGVSMNF